MREREKKALLYGGIAIALILIFNFWIYPASQRLKEARAEIEIKKQELKQLIALGERYKALKGELSSKGKKAESLFSYLSSLPQKLGIKEKLVYIKPLGKEKYEVKLEGLTNKELVRYLAELEKSGIADIKDVKIKAGGNPRRITLSMVVAGIE